MFSSLISKAYSKWEEFWNGFISGFSFTALGIAGAGFIIFLMYREGYWLFKANVMKKAPDDSYVIPDKLESEQDRLNRKYQKKNRRKFR